KLADWQAQLASLKEAVRLWDEVVKARSQDDAAGLRERIRWERNEDGWRAAYSTWPDNPNSGAPAEGGNWELIVDEQTSPEWLQHFSPGTDVIGPATLLLQRWANRQLRGQVSSRLLYDPRSSSLMLRSVPESLQGCLWLQFARVVCGEEDPRQCLFCR